MNREDREGVNRGLKLLQRVINLLLRLPAWVRMLFRVQWYRLLGVRIGWNCWMESISIPRNPWDIRLGRNVALDKHVVLLAQGDSTQAPRILIGEGTYVNRHTMIDAIEKVEIGRDCLIGPQVFITDYDHGRERGITMAVQPVVSAPVTIEDEVWLGAGAIILKGVRIGSGAVVGAGAVVTRDVAPETVVAGVPARGIGVRRGADDWSRKPFVNDI